MDTSTSDPSGRTIWSNQSASSFRLPPVTDTDFTLSQKFHAKLPAFRPSPLVPLDDLAAELGVKGIFLKDESDRLGLPAFKILGASWGTFRALCHIFALEFDAEFDDVAAKAREVGIKLVAATDGNHGRAVARMAKLMGIKADIFVPSIMNESTEAFIAGEDASVIRVDGDYDIAVEMAAKEASNKDTHVQIQDNSFEGYETIPKWIIEGYSTMLMEVESQLSARGAKATTIFTPVGVGSLAHSVVSFAKSAGRGIRVVALEPVHAACLYDNLNRGNARSISTTETIMAGMNCGTVSPLSWPILKQGIDASLTVSEWEAHEAVQYLQKLGVKAGPCGAGAVAALRRIAAASPKSAGLERDSIVVLLSTEGPRDYVVPEKDS